MSAWLMAVCTRGMSRAETLALTEVMVASGEVLDLSAIPGIKVDKHSTGGVGDKVTLIACPVAAACGVPVPKLSGRALAHTGGTLDKLESVPGLTVDLEPDRFRRQVAEVGLAVAAQSPRMVPADKALYALRDASATVPSVPLIASSVMSKKIAAGADAIVLDVKFGTGAFMADPDMAIFLASEMVQIGGGAGRPTVALVTSMEQPLGRAVGNALEVAEALEILGGGGDRELREVAIAVADEMCRLAGMEAQTAAALASGRAREVFERMVAAQGGRLGEGLPRAACQVTVTAPSRGYVQSVDALAVGSAARDLGAGRQRRDVGIDPTAGVEIVAPGGSWVEPGDPLCVVHAASDGLAESVRERLRGAWLLGEEAPTRRPHVVARVTGAGIERPPQG